MGEWHLQYTGCARVQFCCGSRVWRYINTCDAWEPPPLVKKVHNVCDHQLTAVDSVDSDVFSLVMFFVFSDVQLSFACFQFTVMSTVWFWFFSACVAATRPNARPPFDNPKYSVGLLCPFQRMWKWCFCVAGVGLGDIVLCLPGAILLKGSQKMSCKLSRQAQHFGDFHLHFAWQAQHFRRVEM